ncbi:MAG: 1-deoxy-D-xylulose-5-phosphate reductoisomerase, partial [Proteobacteria bacterium]|nr:1-deoxy-D-xylulose-5-phosphate reductoisomerase [Pseudomonadota bacterium]
MAATHNITILGSTGSVGQNTLAVIEAHPTYSVYALTAHRNIDLLLTQCRKFSPRFAVVTDPESADLFYALLQESDCDTELLRAEDALAQVASAEQVDSVMAAIVGAAGLQPTLAAVTSGKRVLLANKESLVMSGALFMGAAAESGAVILPIDSEHNAIYQCLPSSENGVNPSQNTEVLKIILTASGGPFLDLPGSQFGDITPEQACRHPKWRMGQKISVDSATMMNKGLEVIEACYLFALEPAQVEVLIHPQSIVHSMVYYRDGSVLAQLANPDMRIPIAYGLAWPQRIESGAKLLDLTATEPLTFLQPDLERFPCLRLGMEAARQQGTMPAVLNAA